jgi:hypothetical protein
MYNVYHFCRVGQALGNVFGASRRVHEVVARLSCPRRPVNALPATSLPNAVTGGAVTVRCRCGKRRTSHC